MLLHCLLVRVVSDTFRCSLYLVPFYVNVFFSLLAFEIFSLSLALNILNLSVGVGFWVFLSIYTYFGVV